MTCPIEVGDRIRVREGYWICPRCGSRDMSATCYPASYPSPMTGKTIVNEHNTPNGRTCRGGWELTVPTIRGWRYRFGMIAAINGTCAWIRWEDQDDHTRCVEVVRNGQRGYESPTEYFGLRPYALESEEQDVSGHKWTEVPG